MRIPYVVGRWVRGKNHYGRQRLIDTLLSTPDSAPLESATWGSATWLVGTRRMGKTSLLRQLEYVTATGETPFVPIFWDLQGCRSSGEASNELAYSLEEAHARFEQRGIDGRMAADQDAADVLRMLGRKCASQGIRPLLLIDEAEALIQIAAGEQAWLAKLRKTLQEGNLRCIVTSTKLLAKLNDMNAEWTTSPFLFGFNMANLWQLDLDAARALIRQEQSANPVRAEDTLVGEILRHTSGHPYLIQFLCQRLFTVDDRGRGMLRDPEDEDLNPDQILSGFFRIDFQYLTRGERRILLAVSDLSVATREEVLAALSEESPQRVDLFLYGLRKFGYLQPVRERWAIGNEYLRRWLQDNRSHLGNLAEPQVADSAFEEMLREGRDNEAAYLHCEIDDLEAELKKVGRQERGDEKTLKELNRIRLDLKRARREVEKLEGDT